MYVLTALSPTRTLTAPFPISRGGMIAPLLGGALLVVDRSFPVYTSVVIFALAGGCTLLLKETEGATKSEERVFVH